jgi:CxxC motif-containing protein (DUF1111 family)
MSRLALAILLVWVVACSDQTDVMAPDHTSETPAVTPPSGAVTTPSDMELDFSRGAFGRARTALSGGATTVFDASSEAFSLPAPNLRGLSIARHDAGDVAFEDVFGADPAGEHPGLGPVFDNVSCESCHVGDGRGRPPEDGLSFNSLLFRASITGPGSHGAPQSVPGFGGQLQLRANEGYTPEVHAQVSYSETSGSFTDGTEYKLNVPQYTISGWYSALPAGFLFSPRVAPVVFGLGLLEAVPEQDIRALAYQRGRGRQGISGRPNYVWDAARQRTVMGRFGWKANAPNLVQQTAGAYNGDMGVTSTLFPTESCEGEYAEGCGAHPIEVNNETVAAVAFYTRTLGVPARRDLNNPKSQQGEQLFYASGCDGCHTPTLRTGFLRGVREVSNQVIHPYTDLLLHDMGPALADGRPDFLASGSEWRTPPLWGVGLVSTVNGHTNFLHDGRARSLLEAVLWHGGEAKAARDHVLGLSASQREALVAFLSSL